MCLVDVLKLSQVSRALMKHVLIKSKVHTLFWSDVQLNKYMKLSTATD